MEKLINNPRMRKYARRFERGQALFWEGEESRELFILVSGELNVLKGDKVIAHMDQPGTIFGEMSFLLGGKRTATVRALSQVEVLVIPQEDIEELGREYPDMAQEITKLLAERLDQTSQVVYGLREFCDQLPDAVVLTDPEGKVLSLNRAARELYGRDYAQLRDMSLADIYEEPQAFRDLQAAVQKGQEVREKVLAIEHPRKGRRWLSLSMNALVDTRQKFQGVMILGRDVTTTRKLKRRLRLTMRFLVPALVVLGLYFAGTLLGMPYFLQGYEQAEVPRHELRNQLAKDFFLLHSMLDKHFAPPDRAATHPLLQKFVAIQEKKAIPYSALILLDKDKRVFDALVVKGGADADSMLGNTYARLHFQGRPDSVHKVLTGYRKDASHPSSYRVVELAFAVGDRDQPRGWIVFQMDMDMLRQVYKLDEEALKKFRFQSP